MNAGRGGPLKSDRESLPGGAGRLPKQAEEETSSVGMGGKLCHVAHALRQGDDGGTASKHVRKPLCRLPARVVVVEGEEDAGAAPEG